MFFHSKQASQPHQLDEITKEAVRLALFDDDNASSGFNQLIIEGDVTMKEMVAMGAVIDPRGVLRFKSPDNITRNRWVLRKLLNQKFGYVVA